MFNKSFGKNWTISQMKNSYLNCCNAQELSTSQGPIQSSPLSILGSKNQGTGFFEFSFEKALNSTFSPQLHIDNIILN